MVTVTSLWFGGHRSSGVADALAIEGGGFSTVTVAVAELLLRSGSGGLDAPTVAVFAISVPSGVAQATFTTTLNVAVSPGPIVALVHVIVPPLPGDGVWHDQPVGAETEAKAVPAGIGSLIVTWLAVLLVASTPLLLATRVYARLAPESTLDGADLVTDKSACIETTLRTTTLSMSTPHGRPGRRSAHVLLLSCVNSKRSCAVLPAMPGSFRRTCLMPTESPAHTDMSSK